MRVLVFDIDDQRFGLDASGIREVLPAATLTVLPNLPPTVEGVLNVRGGIVAVVNVRDALGLEPRRMRATDHLVIANSRNGTIGLHVDHAIGIISIDESNLAAADKIVGHGDPITRVAQLDGGLISIHGVDDIVADWQTGNWHQNIFDTAREFESKELDTTQEESHAAD